MSVENRPLLISGHHRSGSTWVGKMLAASAEFSYIWEPFNPLQRAGICSVRPSKWYLYVYDDEPERWKNALKRTLSFEYDLSAEVGQVASAKDAARLIKDHAYFTWCGLQRKRPLIKDPIALFSSEWIASTFNCDVVLLIRHPAAFISSLMRLKWEFPFEDLLHQPQLLSDHLYPFVEDIRSYSRSRPPLIDQGILLWKIFAHAIHKFGSRNSNWMVLRHEDISRTPIYEFEKIFKHVNAKFTSKAERRIKKTAFAKSSSSVGGNTVHNMSRDSKRNIYSWKKRLSINQIEYIYDRLNAHQDPLYTDKDW